MPITIPSFKLQLHHLLYFLKLLMKHLQVSVDWTLSLIDLLSCADVIYEKFMESPTVICPTGVDGLQ